VDVFWGTVSILLNIGTDSLTYINGTDYVGA